eukprot:TRINITY_DN24923_c0_g1_i1.p1 TRINITY_DN24923_c0_g1~~TRINITY_DN24923_c0_g1_i1.p1  ORF type:complete len:248 (-),score=52.95 TRINITY_DN24923_c0_g1_i1:184-885(-)
MPAQSTQPSGQRCLALAIASAAAIVPSTSRSRLSFVQQAGLKNALGGPQVPQKVKSCGEQASSEGTHRQTSDATRIAALSLAGLACGCWASRRRQTVARRAEEEAEAAAPAAKAQPKAKAKAKGKAVAKKNVPPLAVQIGEGVFAPAVTAGYAILGQTFIEKVRGKGIELHSRTITDFCTTFALPSKKRQGFIKTAKKTGHDLGMLVEGGHFDEGLFGHQAMAFYESAKIAEL